VDTERGGVAAGQLAVEVEPPVVAQGNEDNAAGKAHEGELSRGRVQLEGLVDNVKPMAVLVLLRLIAGRVPGGASGQRIAIDRDYKNTRLLPLVIL